MQRAVHTIANSPPAGRQVYAAELAPLAGLDVHSHATGMLNAKVCPTRPTHPAWQMQPPERPEASVSHALRAARSCCLAGQAEIGHLSPAELVMMDTKVFKLGTQRVSGSAHRP